jgi:hypothetical protein
VAALGALAGGGLAARITPAFATATHSAWWTVVGLGVLVGILGVLTTTGWAQHTARRTADLFREDRQRLEVAPATGPA